METLIQQIVNGLVLGAVYALVALGYTMVYGILGLINFAHGEVVMVGALVTLAVIKPLAAAGVPAVALLPLGLIVAMLVCMALGATVERIAYRPLRNAPRLAPLITAIGVSIVLQYGAVLIWGRGYHAYPELLPTTPLEFFGARISPTQIAIVLVSSLIMAGLLWLVHRTRLGRAMRATAENPAVARLMGVNVDQVISLTFVIGSALGAVAGVLVSINYSVAHYQMGFTLGLKAFTAAVLGGIGNLGGAMVGGLLLGLIEALGAGYIGDLTGGLFGSNYRDVFAFLVLVAVLIFRPSGLLGERVAERA
ncbi:branched-chain amino acid ABC transporter permease [Denitratisoma oestradiolicum]|uniref:Leucine/isoleucine/valine transporter subunit membrane component of ABC superfamily n=1 Tax=Denitratisoma oestradiolicum TaxID=311182 RepID=A0A6S6XRZ7_9PROT|nr:branched-chain amino acid ABC transporter permease [Denitratisoma oestradiolicum]TWO79731.1 branched-chain amino acid ABC transporter permease [Denitratisoma oestradiolicum]CAB1367495.1 leucine/isoleucine/valine transporter subunit; membrane component of ABC superfamily [Denitratisoma oestradiolicum]